MTEFLATLADSRLLLSGAVFLAASSMVIFVALLLTPVLQTRRRLTASLLTEGISNRRSLEAQTELVKIAARRPVEAYFAAAEKERGEPNALEAKSGLSAPRRDAASPRQRIPRRAKNIVRQLGIVHGAGEHEGSHHGGGGGERLVLALAWLQIGGHSAAPQTDHAAHASGEALPQAAALT